MSNRKQIAIYGAGGHAREIAWLISASKGTETYNLAAYVEDNADGHRIVNGTRVLSWEQLCVASPSTLMAVAVGDPKGREKLVKRCTTQGFEFARLVHRSVELSESVELGVGAVICCGTILTVNIVIGNHVHINVGCTVSHDVRIGDFTTLAPSVHVSGNVHIGRGVYIGTGANIINGTTNEPLLIRDRTVIGAGACITRSTEADALYTGVPAELKKRYT